MFTGIVEEIGIISGIHHEQDAMKLTVQCEKVLEDVKIGDSIAVNGVCLTVASYETNSFTADLMPETLKSTALHTLYVGSKVNLERAMLANSRFGGHIVSGHIDATGKINRINHRGNALYLEIGIAKQWQRYFILKGSVAVDGTSLTVFDVHEDHFVISLIPTTQMDSILGSKQVGDLVNIECDMLAKYTEKLLRYENTTTTNLTAEMLTRNGFL
ncbi:riboflavin synthase [Cytobacillus gottheilii]|uniref:riboflavin synthase n=1 Tax=Cytobacillus gottheilii TaxID=859144 RepID=UPI003CE70A96